MAVLSLFCAVMVATSSARAQVLWRGDFATGDLSQWTKRQTVDAATRLRVVRGGEIGAAWALQATVRHGDDPIGASGHRSELVYLGDDVGEGDTRVYRWQVRWPEDYASVERWQIFTQWHHSGPNGSPPVALLVRGEEVRLVLAGAQVLWSGPLERIRWHDVVLEVVWSSDPSQGRLTLWYDGVRVLADAAAQTLFPGQGVYLKQGLYRAAAIRPEQSVYQRGMTIGRTLADVWPERPDAPPPVVPIVDTATAIDTATAPLTTPDDLVEDPAGDDAATASASSEETAEETAQETVTETAVTEATDAEGGRASGCVTGGGVTAAALLLIALRRRRRR